MNATADKPMKALLFTEVAALLVEPVGKLPTVLFPTEDRYALYP